MLAGFCYCLNYVLLLNGSTSPLNGSTSVRFAVIATKVSILYYCAKGNIKNALVFAAKSPV